MSTENISSNDNSNANTNAKNMSDRYSPADVESTCDRQDDFSGNPLGLK